MNCCICGTVKIVGQYLDKIFSNIEKIGSLFDNYVIIFYYDHSNDNTLQKMKDYQQKVGVERFIFYVNKIEISKYRTHRIANARNNCLQIVKNNYSTWPFFIMIDCDDKCSENVKINVLQKYLRRNDWDSLSFNKKDYYDCWALSIKPYMFSCHHFNSNNVVGKLLQYITQLLKQVPPGGLLKCASAFNGFAIYRTEKFLNCTYDGKFRLDLLPSKYLKENMKVCKSGIHLGPEDCEHRAFHFEAIHKNNARIRISPEIVF